MAPSAKSSNLSETAREALDKGYARAWIFDTDGNDVEGVFKGTTSGMTSDYGRQPIVLVEVDGEVRSIWAMHKALQSQMKETKPKVNDIIAIRRLEKTKSKGGMTYFPYRVVNLSAPVTKEADWSLFGSEPQIDRIEPDRYEEASVPEDEDPIPF